MASLYSVSMKKIKAVLLLEVAFVVLLVSIMSVFMFRAFSVFIRAQRRCYSYLQNVSYVEQKMCDLQLQSAQGEFTLEIEKEGVFGETPFNWQLTLDDAGFESLSKCTLLVSYLHNRPVMLDAISYFSLEAE